LATSPEASIRNGSEAVLLAERAAQLRDARTPALLDILAAAYAEAGRFSEAVQTAQQAIQMASAQADTALTKLLGERIKLYRAGSAFRDARPVGTVGAQPP
jgi:tetratricopeptide (TPR) repeat protein